LLETIGAVVSQTTFFTNKSHKNVIGAGFKAKELEECI